VYASVCADAAIPEMDDLFGARLEDHAPVEQVRLSVVAPLGGLHVGDVFDFYPVSGDQRHWPATLELKGGEVIAVDQDRRPALVANTYGAGEALLCAYPIESYLAVRPAAFEGDDNTYRLYRAFSKWAGVTPLFRSDQLCVEVAGLVGDKRGYAILANHCSQERQVTVTTTLPIRSISQVTPKGVQSLSFEKHSWRMGLEGFSGAVVEWNL
jgi:hypothetical protein